MTDGGHAAADVRWRLGTYYTPRELSELLCRWAIRASTDRVLEPSFGGCVFLRSASTTLSELGAKRPLANLFGCDIDPAAFHYLDECFSGKHRSDNFFHGDFLAVSRQRWGDHLFDAVLGNPPYVSRHNMSPEQRASAEQALNSLENVRPAKTASLWAYFVSRSLQFLAPGGRMAWVLPGSIGNTHYGIHLVEQISQRFKHVSLVSISERFFDKLGADESTTLLLCDDFCPEPVEARPVRRHYAGTLAECFDLLSPGRGSDTVRIGDDTGNDVRAQLDRLTGEFGFEHLENLANTKIGVVTGDNKFFLLTEGQRRRLRVPNALTVPVAHKLTPYVGLFITEGDHVAVRAEGAPGWMLRVVGTTRSNRLSAYLAQYPEAKKLSNKTFAKRSHWSCPVVGETPDAFLSYMSGSRPRLLLNTGRLQCTNNTHRVYFKVQVPQKVQLLAAVSFASTLTATSAELVGRTYGSGVLKLEPSEAQKLLLAVPGRTTLEHARGVANQIDTLCRQGHQARATSVADKFVLDQCATRALRKLVKTIMCSHALLRRRRYPVRQHLDE